MDNITKYYTENTGGGCLVDFLELENGLILAVSDEYVGLYASKEEFYNGNCLNGFWTNSDLIYKE